MVELMEEVLNSDECQNDDLYQSILETSQYFTSIVELLPGKFYINQDSKDEEFNSKSRNRKNKKRKPKLENKKLLAKKAKLLKLDPSQHKTIAELQEEVEKKEEELYNDKSNNISMMKPVDISNVASASLEELREKLHAKMKELRGNRKLPSELAIGKSRLEKKKKNALKKKKQEVCVNIKRVSDIENIAIGTDVKNNNGTGEIVFSKFDFATGLQERKKKNKDLKKLLSTAEKKQDKMKMLQETDIEKAEELKKKISWDSAFKKAEGIKLKDNPKLIKKSIKRKEKQKQYSEKKWDDRIATVEKKKEEKQALRKQHLKERREDKVNKKKGMKKKKSRPGF